MWREAGGRWWIGMHHRIGKSQGFLRAFSSPLCPLGIDNWEVWDGTMWQSAPRVSVVRPQQRVTDAAESEAESEAEPSEAESEAESEAASEAGLWY